MAWSPQARAAAIASRKAHAHGKTKLPMSNRKRRLIVAGAGAAALGVHHKTGRGVTKYPIVSAAIAAGATNAYLKRRQKKASRGLIKHPMIAMHGHHGNKVASLQAQKKAYNAAHQAKVAKFTKNGKYSQYKKTGLVRPTSTQGKTWHTTVHRYNKASSFNKAHGSNLDKLNKSIAQAQNKAYR